MLSVAQALAIHILRRICPVNMLTDCSWSRCCTPALLSYRTGARIRAVLTHKKLEDSRFIA